MNEQVQQIRAEIERRKIVYRSSENLQDAIRYDEITELLAFIDSLPESAKRGYKDCNGCEYNRTIKDQLGWQFRGCFGGEYKGKPIAEIELCPLKVATLPEQPVEGLEEAAEKIASEIVPTYPDISWECCFEKIKEGVIAGAEWQKAKIMERAVKV